MTGSSRSLGSGSRQCSRETLGKLQRGELDLNGREEAVALVVAPQLITYNDTWDKIDAMLDRIGDSAFRSALPDTDGRGWVYNWHCLNHVGYTVNPRRRDMGFHNVFDHYKYFIDSTQAPNGLHWHFHPTHPSLEAHRTGTFFFRDNKIFEIMARRVIDRGWFPSVNRAGFHVERPDSQWVLEQWIPFDISNQACDRPGVNDDIADGRFGDWRRAPQDWSIYHPDYDDYQAPGNSRRWIARCLNVGTRYHLLDEGEVRKAFDRARREGPTLIAFTDHDFRDMSKDVDYVRGLLRKVTPDYPDVPFRYCEAREAMNRCLFGECTPPRAALLSARLEPGPREGAMKLTVEASEPTFGPQPFLAIQTRGGAYYHENLDCQEPFRRWSYVFDWLSLPWDTIEHVAVASNDRRGFPHVVRVC